MVIAVTLVTLWLLVVPVAAVACGRAFAAGQRPQRAQHPLFAQERLHRDQPGVEAA